MKKKIIQALLLLLLIADMAFIFFNSAQVAAVSAGASQSVTEMVAPVIVPHYKEMDDAMKQQAVASLEGVLREAAHLLQFVPMGFALYLLLHTVSLLEKIGRMRIPLTICFGFLYAISDEIHQLFVPGRSFQLFDIFMDTSGVTIGCVAGIILYFLVNRITKKTKTS